MFRAMIVRSLWVILCGGSLAFGQEPPPLEGPASNPVPPQVTTPPSPETTKRPPASNTAAPVATEAQTRPTLVIPGVTVPSSRAGAVNRVPVPQPSRSLPSTTPAAGTVSPSVSAPENPGSPFRPPAGAPTQAGAEPSSLAPISLSLEPLDDVPAATQNRSAAAAVRSPGSGSTKEPATDPARARPAPWRMPGFLGRVIGQTPTGTAREATRSANASTKAQPEGDAAVKKRIEQQIRSTLGDKVKSVEVRVSGRNVLIVGRATRFWQRRTVQRTLETLPALTGYRARIDLDN
jgi:hypothetical protein